MRENVIWNRITVPKKDAAGRGAPGSIRWHVDDTELFQSIMAGEHCLRGFTNGDGARILNGEVLALLQGVRAWELPTLGVSTAPARIDILPACPTSSNPPRAVAPSAAAAPGPSSVASCVSASACPTPLRRVR